MKVRNIHTIEIKAKKRKIKEWKKAAAVLLAICVALQSEGCKSKEADTLQTLDLEEPAGESGNPIGEELSSTGEDTGDESKDSGQPEGSGEEAGTKEEGTAKNSTIFVYVCGAVNRPGVYELKADARVYEAIACAGGTRADAAADIVNQAQKMTDGERVYIPTQEEVRAGMIPAEEGITDDTQAGEKININTASKEELMTLPGIGASRADAILAYRKTNGPFQAAEELMNVEGIKEGVFDKIKDGITVQ